MTARELLAAVRQAQGLASNYALGRALGIPDNTLQRWNTGANTPDDTTAARLAELAGLDPGAVVAAMHAQRAKTDPERQLWQAIAARLTKAGAVAAAAILSLWITGGPDAGASLALGLAAPLWIAEATVYTLGTVAILAAALGLHLAGPRLAGCLVCRDGAAPAV